MYFIKSGEKLGRRDQPEHLFAWESVMFLSRLSIVYTIENV